VIAAGGTAGHVLPALAVADALRARGASVSFAGSPERIEATLVPAAGYELDALRVDGLPRAVGTRLLRALATDARAPLAARRLLTRRRPHVVLSAGGYTGGPAVLAAASLRIPAAVTEADAHLGLANRLAAPFAARVFLAYPLAGRGGSKYRVVGRPVPARSRAPAGGRTEARRRFGLPQDGPVVLVPRCSSPTRTPPPTTRPGTPATSSGAAAPSSSRTRSSTCAAGSTPCSPTRPGSRRWAMRCSRSPAPGRATPSPRS